MIPPAILEGDTWQVRDERSGTIYVMARSAREKDKYRKILKPVAILRAKPKPDPAKEPTEESSIRHFVDQVLAEEDLGDFEDDALEFIETQVGRYQFPANWLRDRATYLPLFSRMPDGEQILAEVDRLASENATFDDLRRYHTLEIEGRSKKKSKR